MSVADSISMASKVVQAPIVNGISMLAFEVDRRCKQYLNGQPVHAYLYSVWYQYMGRVVNLWRVLEL